MIEKELDHWLVKDPANISTPANKRNSNRGAGKDSLDRSGDGSLTPTRGKSLRHVLR